MNTALKPWLAYSRSSRASTMRGFLGENPADHATTDGRTTLCGLKEIGGHEPSIVFDPDGSFACRRCAKKARSE